MLKEGGVGDDKLRQYIAPLSYASRLLADVHHAETISRRELAAYNLNKGLKSTLSDAPLDEWLFGADLEGYQNFRTCFFGFEGCQTKTGQETYHTTFKLQRSVSGSFQVVGQSGPRYQPKALYYHRNQEPRHQGYQRQVRHAQQQNSSKSRVKYRK